MPPVTAASAGAHSMRRKPVELLRPLASVEMKTEPWLQERRFPIVAASCTGAVSVSWPEPPIVTV